MKLSANLGFLWQELPLPEAIMTAKKSGFDAVELHWPYDYDPDHIRTVLDETKMPVLGLNTDRGDLSRGENGLSALPGREAEAKAAIDKAIDFATVIGADNIHVMAGFTEGKKAHDTFIDNLAYACVQAQKVNKTILIEPLNHYDAPGYFLSSSSQAANIIEQVGADNIKLMFDCYHLQLLEGDISNSLKKLYPIIGHIQIAAVPDRGEPDKGEIDYRFIFEMLTELGHTQPIGIEYKPRGTTDEGLSWRDILL